MPYGDSWDSVGWRQFMADQLDYHAGLTGAEPVNPWKLETPAYKAGLANGGYAIRAMREKNLGLDSDKDQFKPWLK